MYSPFFHKLLEFTLMDFRGQSNTAFTRKFRKQRDKIRGKESKVAIVANVKKVGSNLDVYFLTIPTHAETADEVTTTKQYPPAFKHTSAYTVILRIEKFFEWKSKPIMEMTTKDLADILKVADVKWFSTSPSFFLQGVAYELTQIGASLQPVNVYPKIWGNRTDHSLTTKHMAGIIDSIYTFLPEILNQLRMKVKRSKHYQK